MLVDGLEVHSNLVLPVSGSTETDVNKGDEGGSVMQSVWENALPEQILNRIMII